MKYAEVAVNSPVSQRRTFSYSIPEDMSLSVGQAVWVPFGPRSLQGVVFEISGQPQVEETKQIAQVIDPRPVLQLHLVELAKWIADSYLSSYFEAAALMLPPGFEQRVLTFLHPAPTPSSTALSSMNDAQREIFSLIQDKQAVELGEIKKAHGKKAEATVAQLLRKGLITRTRELARLKVRPLYASYVKLAVTANEARKTISTLQERASRQADILRVLLERQTPAPVSDVLSASGGSAQTLAALVKKGLVSVEETRVERDPLAHRSFAPTTPLAFTRAQENAWNEIEAAMNSACPGRPPVFLLHGVTGSGKTEVYLRAVTQCVSSGKQAIVLVPEIALTPQTINRFASRFPGRVAVLHSKLSLGEQFDEWQKIKEGDFDVVIGSRGALFAPVPNIGLIVIDEEHEWTYKQTESQPRYHARDVALKLAGLTGSTVILGSATPDLVSYHRAQRQEYRLLELPDRISSGTVSSLPHVEIVDLRRELKEGNASIFSRALARGINEALAAKEQVILFLNRRGTASIVQCRDCGFVMKCRRCDVSLTYHTSGEDMVCHYCNAHVPIPRVCPECWSKRIKFLGIGTERVEEDVKRNFPSARVLRWDRDVTQGKNAHEKILDSFVNHRADILVGTQMIAKGLDLPLVTLVGVINADIGLHLPDYRSSERTFQILAQVAGRAGRGKRGGRAIVQTYAPLHYAVTAAAKHDYASFYRQEIAFRQQQGNPPFSRLARLLYVHTNNDRCKTETQRAYLLLEEKRDALGLPGVKLIGPSPAFTPRIRGRYRWQIIVRCPDPLPLLSDFRLPQGWTVDVDPVGMG